MAVFSGVIQVSVRARRIESMQGGMDRECGGGGGERERGVYVDLREGVCLFFIGGMAQWMHHPALTYNSQRTLLQDALTINISNSSTPFYPVIFLLSLLHFL